MQFNFYNTQSQGVLSPPRVIEAGRVDFEEHCAALQMRKSAYIRLLVVCPNPLFRAHQQGQGHATYRNK